MLILVRYRIQEPPKHKSIAGLLEISSLKSSSHRFVVLPGSSTSTISLCWLSEVLIAGRLQAELSTTFPSSPISSSSVLGGVITAPDEVSTPGLLPGFSRVHFPRFTPAWGAAEMCGLRSMGVDAIN